MHSTPPSRAIRILHLEDSVLDHDLAARTLRKAGLACELVRVETLQDFLQTCADQVFDIILADYRLAGFTALDAWAALQQQPRQPPFVLLSGAIGESAAVEAIKLGISDYVLKDEMGKLAHVLQRTLEMQEARLAKARADAELAASERRLAQFADHLQMTIEQERAAIAREIHDDIGGSLAAIRFDLSWLDRHHQDDASRTHVASALGMLQHAIGASQRIMRNLRPAILDQGLDAAIEWLAREFERRTGIRTTVRIHLQHSELGKPVQLAAYRVAQEALTNITKHAACSEVRLELTDAERVLTLEIADNGCGIDAADRDKPKAFGLKGLHERARGAGGWLDVSSRQGAGTAITLTIPLTDNSPTQAQDVTP